MNKIYLKKISLLNFLFSKVVHVNFLPVLFLLFVSSVQAQQITVDSKIDSTVIWIGDQTNLSFEVSQMPDKRVQFPIFSDNIPGGLEIVEPLKIDTTSSADGYLIVKHQYLVTAFQDSLLYIPPFPFIIDEDTIWSKSVSLKVVRPFELDMEANAITDIKPVYKPKFNWAGFFKIVLLVILIIGLAIGLYVLIRKYIQNKPVFEPIHVEPRLPAHVIALEGLNKIKDEKPWQQGRLKEYYTELTDIVRVYMARVFEMNAMEMTTDEILDALHYMRKENKQLYGKLQNMMRTADLVKFAKWKPMNDESEQSLKDAFLFVEQTKQEEEPEEAIAKEELKINTENLEK